MRAHEMITDARDMLQDPEGDYWTNARMLRHLNRSLSDVTSRARTIREVHYRRANIGQSVYSMRGDFLGNDKVAWLYNGEWYPLIKRTLAVTEYLSNTDWVTSYRPFYYDVWGRTREERIVASVTEVSSRSIVQGNWEVVDPSLGIGTMLPESPSVRQVFSLSQTEGDNTAGIYICFTAGTWTRVPDSPPSGNTLPATCSLGDLFLIGNVLHACFEVPGTEQNPRFLDAEFPTNEQTFGFKFAENLRGTGDVKVGDLILNMTDGSEGFVVERDDEHRGNELFAYALLENGMRSGADAGKILVGDEVRILSPNVSGHALRIAPPPTEDSGTGEEILWVYYSRKHYTIEQAHIDAVNDMLELDIELETPALERLIYWCRREELGASDPEVQAQMQAFESAYFLALPKVRQRIREHESTWGTPSIDAFRANIELEGVTTPVGHVYNRFNIR